MLVGEPIHERALRLQANELNEAAILLEQRPELFGGREREHAPARSAVGDDKGVDLARADRAQRVFGLRYPCHGVR
jgi:hypothetical protein